MLSRSIVIYTGRPLRHILRGCPGRVHRAGLVDFQGVLRPVSRDQYAPARLWWRKGAGKWMGPYTSFRKAMADLGRVCADLEHGVRDHFAANRDNPQGAEIVSGGWRYRIAWAGDRPPVRDG